MMTLRSEATGPRRSDLLAGCSKLGILSDIHIGVHDEDAVKVVVECMEAEGVDGLIANGDIHDCGPVSRHAGKAKRAALENGQLLEEAASGRWIVDWFRTRPTAYIPGNHEDWINDLALETNTVGTLTVASALGLPEGPDFVVFPHGSQLRFGSLVVEHGDLLFPRGGGPANLARAILAKYPSQTTIAGHFHRDDFSCHTTPDHAGIARTHAAHTLGHLSDPRAHKEYAGRDPNWQQGAGIVRLWRDGGRIRFTVDHLMVHRDRYDRPVLEYAGRVYR